MAKNVKKAVKREREESCEICTEKHDTTVSVGNSVGDGGELGLSIAEANGVNDLQKYKQQHPFSLIRESRTVKGKIYYQIEAHHLICSEAMDDEEEDDEYTWMDLCQSFGYDINCKENGVFLPSNLEMACAKKVPLHRGNHEATIGEGQLNYVDSVKKLIKPIKKNATSYCNNPEDFKKDLDENSKMIFGYVKEFTWTLTTDGKDYGGKIGCLNAASFSAKRKKVLGEILSGTAKQQVDKATLQALQKELFCKPEEHCNENLKERIEYNLIISK